MRSIFFLTAAVALAATSAFAQTTAATVNVDINGARHTIDPRIYGVAHATTAQLDDLNVVINRSGGNNTSRYNWTINADNRGFDWYFESVPYDSAVAGEYGDSFITSSRAGGAEPMLTIPMIGWVGKLGAGRSKLASFSIAKYGPQTGNDWEWMPDAGNGISAITGQYITGNDPNDANVPSNSLFQRGWMEHLVNTWGTAGDGNGLRYFILDNEPSIWHGTHRDVHPTGATMDEILEKIIDYGQTVKAVDPTAQVVAPEEWSWLGYIMSGYDQQWAAENGQWWDTPDRLAHDGWDYLPWVLKELRNHYAITGEKLLDVFSVHAYPQSGEFSNDVSTNMQLLRNRSTRSLWDPNYTDESWIADEIYIVPHIREWVATYYPGAQTAITEYNWGAEGHINGATTQADIFGIFGRERLDLGARWTTPGAGTPVYNSIKMYRNYDGAKSTFGDVSVPLTGPNPDDVSVFAALRSTDGALTVMVINKQLATPASLQLNFPGMANQGSANAWRLASGTGITALGNTPFAGTQLNTSLPPQTITLYVIPAATVSAAPSVTAVSPTAVNPAGSGITISGANFIAGSTVKIGALSAINTNIANPSSITATTPALPAGTLQDVTVTIPNTLSTTRDDALFVRFNDVTAGHPFGSFVEKLVRAGVTGGCGGGNYCPSAGVTRAQMAVFLLKAKFRGNYAPLPATGALFDDVPAGSFAASWIEQLSAMGVTGGCSVNPPLYCPSGTVTRAQMAVFLLAAKYGNGYAPPAATGIFSDVPLSSPFAPWIEQLYNEGITGGCGPTTYCPNSGTTRGQMAVFLSATFGL